MRTCRVLDAGTVELYFYEELSAPAARSFEDHLSRCAECREALGQLASVREALASRPMVTGPADGDWAPFMARLEAAIRHEQVPAGRPRSAPVGLLAYLAVAALLVLVTVSVALVVRSRIGPVPESAGPATAGDPVAAMPAAASEGSSELAFRALTGQHFERSKLVVLGLASRDPEQPEDWTYERELAAHLLDDTQLYRLAAADRGLTGIADVMADLELVLLQAALAEAEHESAVLEQVQRTIRKRDLLVKMNVMKTGI